MGTFINTIIKKVEENPEAPLAFNYTVTRDFGEEIKKAVVDYYQKEVSN